MDAPVTVISANPAGETKNTASYPPGSWPLDTPGGRFFAEWDNQAPVTREGQLIFFFQFLQAKADTAPYERYGAGMNHLGFGATTPEQVLSIRHAMQSAGFEVPEIQNLGGATALFMKDADGVRFEITYYPPGMAVVD